MKMKKIVLGILALSLGSTFTACTAKDSKKESLTSSSQSLEGSMVEEDEKKEDLVVFAAASMTDVLEDIKTIYEKENPDTNLVFNFDSSGTLKDQIVEGADCDIFISAAQKQMDELDPDHSSYNGQVAIKKDSRIDLLENKVVLVVPDHKKKGIKKFRDLKTDKLETLALGNQDVPVGQYSEEILKNLGIMDFIKDKISLGSNVREVASWVKEGNVDAGIVYATDAKAFGLELVDEADDSMLDNKVIYPAALLEKSSKKDQAQKFLKFLQEKEASQIFKDQGFSPLS